MVTDKQTAGGAYDMLEETRAQLRNSGWSEEKIDAAAKRAEDRRNRVNAEQLTRLAEPTTAQHSTTRELERRASRYGRRAIELTNRPRPGDAEVSADPIRDAARRAAHYAWLAIGEVTR